MTGLGRMDVAFCTACGRPADTVARFCTACGAPLAGDTDPDDRAGEPVPELDDAFGGLFAPRRDGPGNRGDTARLPQLTDPGGGGPGWAGAGGAETSWEGSGGAGAGLAGPGGSGPGWAGGAARAGWAGGPGDDWMARPPPGAPNRSKIIIALIGVVALVAVGGGVLGFAMHADHAPSGPGQRTVSAKASQRGTPGSGRPASGNIAVAVAPGVAGNRDVAPIVKLLTSYFSAINRHDFARYRALLDARTQRSVTLAQFARGYRTTTDSGATLTGIAAAAGGRTTANVRFTSHQDPADSPDHSSCTNWGIMLFLERSGSGFLIGRAEPGYHASHQPC